MADEKKTRRSRYFIYNDGVHVVAGKESVRYEPDVKKNMFGSCAVEIYFPKRREAKHSFRLDLYPQVNEKNPEANIIEDVDEGCRLMFLEANRSAGLQVRSICKLSRDEMSYDDFAIVPDATMSHIDENASVVGEQQVVLKGVIIEEFEYLHKGDVVTVLDCGKTDKDDIIWACKWNAPVKKSLCEKIRMFFMKRFNKEKYRARYMNSSLPVRIDVPIDKLRIVGAGTFEKETDRDYNANKE